MSLAASALSSRPTKWLALLALAAVALPPAASAQTVPVQTAQVAPPRDNPRLRRARPVTRIEVYPSRQLYRQCTDWYALEHRQSGDVITPHMRCWWASH
jgi:hypothetical protein